jgi:histidinol-phosphate aminotransferase
MKLSNLIRENVKSLKPYSSARDEFKDASADMIFLDANENPFNSGFNRYPDPYQFSLKGLLAKDKGVAVNNILLGNGSDEVLDLTFRVFCEPNVDNIITFPPTYGMYKVLANTNAVEVREVPLTENFQLDVEATLKEINENTKILFVCSPNNPTANSISRERIEILLRKFKGIVVIDEAYIDFSNTKSWVSRLKEFKNIIVTQTFSKAYGMAGIRLGVCYADQEIIKILNKIKPPYNVNAFTQSKGMIALQKKKVKIEVKEVLKQRKVLEKAFKKVGFVEKVYPSDSNFILIKMDNANLRYDQLMHRGIVVRNRSTQPLCDNCLRITVGTPEENTYLIETLNELV